MKKNSKLEESPMFQLSLGSKELFHTNFLYWLWKAEPDVFWNVMEKFGVKCKDLDRNDWVVKREWKNFDLSIVKCGEDGKVTDIVAVIENKVKSLPRKEQFKEYDGKIRKILKLHEDEEITETQRILLTLPDPNFKQDGWSIIMYEDYNKYLKVLLEKIEDPYHKSVLQDYINLNGYSTMSKAKDKTSTNEKISTKDVASKILELYGDENFQQLKKSYERKTIFGVLDIKRYEIRHSAFLSWILNDKSSHQLGTKPMEMFLGMIIGKVEPNDNNKTKLNEEIFQCIKSKNHSVENIIITTEDTIEHTFDKKASRRIDIYAIFDIKYGDDKTKKIQLLVENKVYSGEHNNQTDDYFQRAKENSKKDGSAIIGVYLTPYNDKKASCDGFCCISYDELLTNVLEPLSTEATIPVAERLWIEDYITNLGQPIDDDLNKIMAVPSEWKEMARDVYSRHDILLKNSLFAAPHRKKENEKEVLQSKVIDKWGGQWQMEGNETKELLKELWEKNERIFKFIFYTLFSEDKFEIEEVVEKALREKVLCLTKTMTRYRVIGQDDEKAVPLSVASVYVFKAWLKKNKNATLADLRNTFTVEECAPGYKNTYQWLFYEKNKIEELFKKWKKEGKTYVVAGNILGETDDRVKNANKYLTWDFFQEGCSGYKDYVLEVKDEKNGKIEVLSMKDWVKDWVKRFLDKAKREGIEVEEVYKTKKR